MLIESSPVSLGQHFFFLLDILVADTFAFSVDMSQIFDMPQSVSKEVEDEANSYFQRIYNHPPHPTLSIEEVISFCVFIWSLFYTNMAYFNELQKVR